VEKQQTTKFVLSTLQYYKSLLLKSLFFTAAQSCWMRLFDWEY